MSLEVASDRQAFRITKNWIRVGDTVDIAREGHHSYPAILRAIVEEKGELFVDIFGGPRGDVPAFRLLPIGSVKKKSKAGTVVVRVCVPPSRGRGRMRRK